MNNEHRKFKIAGRKIEDTEGVIEKSDVVKGKLPSSKYVSNGGHLAALGSTYRRL